MAKKLLSEAVVRRFQQLASVSPINEMYKEEYLNEEEGDETEEMDAPMDAPKAPMGDELMGDTEEGGEETDSMEAGETLELDVDAEEFSALKGLAQAILDAADEAGLGDLADEAPEAPEAPTAVDMGDEDAEQALQEALRGISYEPSKSEIVNEVAKRVAKRLQTAKLHEAKLNRALGRK